MEKSIFKSKTVIVNLIAVVAMILSHWGIILPEGLTAEIMTTLPLANIVLRMITKDKVVLFPKGGTND
jgi:hypothetical protein